ncbi:MAG: hypothetical protein AVDCRST_MAG65-741, partial [uncultured Solirubrobacteraceae bacterium]
PPRSVLGRGAVGTTARIGGRRGRTRRVPGHDAVADPRRPHAVPARGHPRDRRDRLRVRVLARALRRPRRRVAAIAGRGRRDGDAPAATLAL